MIDVFRPEDTPALSAFVEQSRPGTTRRFALESGRLVMLRAEGAPYLAASGQACLPISVLEPRGVVPTAMCRTGERWGLVKPL
jgi:hypothetical protein